MMIPKVIHYCWFGNNELPEKERACIASWRKFCPDYEIIEWNESNFDIDSCAYTKEAYAAKKWAFVSDYARFKILYEHGGIYLDTDVELLKPLDDIISKGAYMGFEEGQRTLNGIEYKINPGLGLAGVAGMKLFREILDFYHSIHFVTKDGGQTMTTIVDHTTNILRNYGLINKNEIQNVAGIYLYPTEYFCPLNFNTGKLNITDRTYSVHHFQASWFSALDWAIIKVERFFSDGGRLRYLCGFVINLPLRTVRKIKNIGFLGTIKLLAKKIWKQ